MPSTQGALPLALATLATLASTSACKPSGDPQAPAVANDETAKAADTEAILAASDLPAIHAEALADDPMAVTIHRLSNGMTVYISTDRQKPRFSAWIAVRTGSRNDPKDSTGLAHYLEHMLFKGTDELGTTDVDAERPHLERIAALYTSLRETDDAEERAKILKEIDTETQKTAQYAISNELPRLYGELGIKALNAFTSDDVTAYIADVPSNRLQAWATVEHERLADPVFRLFYPELEAVYEEKNLALDSPGRRVYEATRRGLFPAHPYGTQSTIGSVEHLKNPAYADMVAYFERWYAPNNMAILLAGDIDAATAIPVLEATLGKLKPKALTAPEAGDLTPVRGRIFEELVADGEEVVSIAWRTVAETDADEPALIVLDWLMDNATSGLLNIHLELTQRLPDAGSSPSHMREAGYWSARGTAREGQSLAEVEAMLMEVVGKLKAGEFSQKTVDAILLHQDMMEKQSLESPGARVSKMMEAFINRRSWADTIDRDRRLRAVTKEDVVRVANKYLGDDRVVVHRKRGKPELPKIDKPTITPLEIDSTQRSPFAERIAAMPATALEPEWLVENQHYVRKDLPAGPMVAVKNTRNDLFSLLYDFEVGHRQERLLCTAFSTLKLTGDGDRSAEALREDLYALGTDIDFHCSADEVSIEISGLDKNLEASVRIMDAWVRTAKIDRATLDQRVDNIISERRDWLDDADSAGYALSSFAAYGQRSEYMVQPSNRQLQQVKPATLEKLLHRFLDQEHRTYYFGPGSAESIAGAVAIGDKHRPTKKPAPRVLRKTKKPVVYFLDKDVAKSTVFLGLPQGVRPDSERPKASLIGQYLDGDMGSLIFQEIREARGLAYSAGGWIRTASRPKDEWAYQGYLATQADKTVDALRTYLEVIARPIDERRLSSAKTALDQSYRASRADPRWMVYWVRSWDLRGVPEDPRPDEWRASVALTPADVQSYATQLTAQPAVISIVGNAERVDLKALAAIAEVKVVKAEDLVSFGPFPPLRASAKPTAH